MATIEASPPAPRQNQDGSPETSFRTIADPRNASTTDLSRSDSSSSRHPDLDSEVAALSDKLISAINHQTSLDDTLARTRQELEASRARIAELEAEARAYEERLARGDLIPRESVEEQNNKLRSELEEEKRQKAQIQQEKRGIESELETLTASLFDEANKMVASANRDRDATEKKNQQLRDQIKDGEAVIASQTEQLAELKELMQQIGPSSDYRKELDSPRVSLAPSSPGAAREDHNLARLLEAMHLSPVDPDHGEIAPSPSSQLTHLLRTICRTDIPAYEDFRNLVQTSHFRSHNPSHAPSRAGSGSYGGLNMMGLGSLSNNSNTNLSQTAQPATSKLANSPNLPGSFSPNPDSRGPVPLKDTRFYKRILVEDIEPTLRLDLSPTLSWLNRRSILSALGDSTLIVEPIPEASLRLYGKYTPCALCGESRKEGENPRTHAMRVRGVGDLVAYVRMVREGVVKVGDRKDEEDAWEELIRLRERLFWARMAGGVVPAFLPTPTKQTPVGNGEMNDVVASVGGASADEMVEVNSTSDNDNDNNAPSHSADADPSERSAPDSPLAGIGTVSPDQAAQLQLQQGLDESLTTFDNIKEKRISNPAGHRSSSTPPTTPPRQRHIKRQSSSGGGISFPRINIPRLPAGFWEAQVNTLT
ncbi:hypothetical protein ABEF95_012976 [Exophiala dermatitidis]